MSEKESFSRVENVLVRNYVFYTDVFLSQMKARLGGDETLLEKVLERIKSIISSVFREALLPVGEEFSVSRFAVRLQQQLSTHIATLKLSEYKWRLLHSFCVEPTGNGLLEVFGGFTFDAELPNQNDIPIFDFKISNLELQSTLIDSTGKKHTDLLRLDAVEEFNLFMNTKTYINTQT